MPPEFWGAYALKLTILALVLGALYAIALALKRAKWCGGGRERCVRVLETTILSPHAAVYVLRIGERVLVVASASGGIVTLAELPPGEPFVRAGNT